MEHASGFRDCHGAGPCRPDRRVWPVFPWRPRVSPRPSATPDDDVSDAVGCRASDDLPDSHARPVLVDTPSVDPVGGGMRDPGRGDAGRGLWRLARDAAWLEVCGDRLELCLRLVPGDRPAE